MQVVQKFFWKNIIACFGISNTLVTDNSLQFSSSLLNEFFGGLGIRHPQTNEQAKAVNKVILNELKKRLDRVNGR